MSYIGKKPVDFNDVTEAQTFTVTGDLTVDTDTLFVDSTNNRVGIGTTSPQAGTGLHIKTGASGATPNGDLIIEDDANVKILLSCPAANTAQIHFGDDAANNVGKLEYIHSSNSMAFSTDATERMRIDSSGNVGIGLTDPDTPLEVQIGSSGNALKLSSDTDGASVFLAFEHQESGTKHVRGRIRAASNGVDGGLIFETGASSSTSERMRIMSDGTLLIAQTANDSGVAGHIFNTNGSAFHVRDGGTVFVVNRLSDDGTLVSFRQAGTQEGSISVSGSTVSYNGGHLSRWSQLTDGTKDTSIVKGTVMTNLDQMAVWAHDAVDGKDAYTEDNEQLNCMAVSSVEGDTNVAGVFVNWDNDDDDFNDMNVAMTGDMVIRIAQGTTVARGDLLMSAGDGTAKPQGDDIVRSKTIAKVISTNVSHTYDDGSYLVPCVLMAC